MLRELRGLTARNVADTTKLSARYVEGIEEESYNKLPARPYLRGFMFAYARAIGYEPDRIVSDYMKRYNAAMNPPKK
jgi:cytoskeletal protein RodZ